MDPKKARIYYDGLCILCSREIEIYKKNSDSSVFEFIDITSANFSPTIEQLDPYEVHRVLHVKTIEGDILTGVNAFIYIWSMMPSYSPLAIIAKQPLIKPLLNIGYLGFARFRKYLPKRKKQCSDSPYCEKPK